MKTSKIKTVGVKELKNSLSAYLREVKLGSKIFVTERNEVIAELREPTMSPEIISTLREQWIREGRLRPSLAPKTPCPRSPIQSPAGTAQKLIDEDRGE